MTSQKSSAAAVAPKRQRGHDRVAAIMDAGAAVFNEKGYEAATMTEIAVRAGAAIGSLYRFFPSKDTLADALIARYGAALLDAFADVEAGANRRSADALAGELIGVMQSLEPERSAAIALADARSDAVERRSTLRSALRERIAAILLQFAPGLTPAKAGIAARLLLHVLKALRSMPREDEASDAALALEARRLVARYLADLRRAPANEA
jgi:AcrR family transcriptional regulator